MVFCCFCFDCVLDYSIFGVEEKFFLVWRTQCVFFVRVFAFV